jgi:plastocyanin
MIRYLFWIAALSAALFSAAAFGGEASKASVVKGAITIAGKPAADVVVSIEGAPQDQSKAQLSGGKAKAVMDQKDLKFNPRVLPVVVGTTVDFPNHDRTFHNVFSNSEAKKFNLGLYPSGQSRSVTFDKPGVVKILCNAHPNMEAYIVVKEHPYFSVADTRGNYNVQVVPLGRYRLEIWHPELGTKAVPVELVREGEVLLVDVELKQK